MSHKWLRLGPAYLASIKFRRSTAGHTSLWQAHADAVEEGWLVSWCFKPSQSQRIIPGLRESFIKRYIVEKTNKAEITPEEQSEKAESCQENLWNEIQLKGQ